MCTSILSALALVALPHVRVAGAGCLQAECRESYGPAAGMDQVDPKPIIIKLIFH